MQSTQFVASEQKSSKKQLAKRAAAEKNPGAAVGQDWDWEMDAPVDGDVWTRRENC